MASKYYNPQVARSLGAAYAKPYVSATAGIEKGMKRMEGMQNAQIEAKKAKAAEWEKQFTAMGDNWVNLNNKIENAPNEVAKHSDPLRKYFLEEFQNDKKEFKKYYDISYGNVDRSVAHQKIKGDAAERIALIKEIPQRMLKNYKQGEDSDYSVANGPLITEQINAEIKGDYTVTGEGKVIFNNKNINPIHYSELGQVDYIPVDKGIIGEKTAQLYQVLERASKNKYSLTDPRLKNEIEKDLGDLNLTRKQSLSVAFDFFGKEQPGFINLEADEIKNISEYAKMGNPEGWVESKKSELDIDKNGQVETAELNKWIKKQLIESGLRAYPGFYKPEEDDNAPGTGRGSKKFNDMLDLAHELSKYSPYEKGILEALNNESIGAAFGGGKDITLVEGEKDAQIAALKEKGYSQAVAEKAVKDADGKKAVVFLKNTPIANFSDLLNYYNQNNFTKTNQLKFTDFNDLFNDLEPEARELFKGQFKKTYPQKQIDSNILVNTDYSQYKINP